MYLQRSFNMIQSTHTITRALISSNTCIALGIKMKNSGFRIEGGKLVKISSIGCQDFYEEFQAGVSNR